MKYKLIKCKLNSNDITKINILCDYFEWNFKCNHERSSYIIEMHDDIAYVQKDERNRLFYVRKSDECIVYIVDMMNIIYQHHTSLRYLKNKFIKELLYFRNPVSKLLQIYG